ncbi:hypothetical protein EYF80_043445 [Liparis tanakae]|uniref:Uncharacterized protein n=1 Tax=Liparis tanakae TaxID=230148 RepID=A0A4Z2FYS9_9TELE|nr:hypothetical protein EYF80_043445 [Liparis tanakae]
MNGAEPEESNRSDNMGTSGLPIGNAIWIRAVLAHSAWRLDTGGEEAQRDDDDQYGGHAADDDNDRQRQQRPLRVADGLHGFLHAGHHRGGPDLQNPSTGREEGLELFVDVQEFTVQKPGGENRSDETFKDSGYQRRRVLKYFNFEAVISQLGPIGSRVPLSWRWRRKSFRRNGNFMVKVTELSEPTGDVINPNTRASVWGTSSTSMKQNYWLVIPWWMKEMITVFTETRHGDKLRPSRSVSTLMARTR